MNKRYTLNEYCDDLTIGKGILYLKKSKESSFPYFLKKIKESCYERCRKNTKSFRQDKRNLA